MTSTVSGMPSTAIAGSIAQSGASVSGAVHVDGSKCFDRVTTIGLNGTLTGSDISLTSTSVNGQITTFTGTISDAALNGADSAFTGTYTITGGCADGDYGSVVGTRIPFIGGNYLLKTGMIQSWVTRCQLSEGDWYAVTLSVVGVLLARLRRSD